MPRQCWFAREHAKRFLGAAAGRRDHGDVGNDMANIRAFHLALYRTADVPTLTRVIENRWLRTGPYLRLLYPEYIGQVKSRRGDWRGRLCAALQRHDGDAARDEIERDLTDALTYLANMADAAGVFRPTRTSGSR